VYDEGDATEANRGEREELLQLLHLCPVAVLRLNAFGDILLMNPHGAQLLMPLARTGDLDNLYDLLSPFAPEVREMAMRYSGRSGSICEEHRISIAGPSGSQPAMTLSLTLNKLDRDLYIAVLADVTASAHRERGIRMSEERLHAVLDGVKDYAICTLDLTGAITSWNRAAERIDDYRSDEVMGRPFTILASGTVTGVDSFKRHLDIARREGWREFEGWRIRKDGSRYWAHCTISVLRKTEEQSAIGFSVVTRDTTERRRSEDKLRLLATTDSLTGCLNRSAFLEAATAEATRFRATGQVLSLLMLDADHFKAINDRYGHQAGDVVLQRIVVECRSFLLPGDVIGRIGGEEFAILLGPAHGEAGSSSVAERMRRRVESAQIVVDDVSIPVTVSIGVAHASGPELSIAAMLRAADAALYSAKHQGRNVAIAASA